MDITQIVIAFIGLLTAIITTILTRYLNIKIEEKNIDILKTLAKIGVLGAEQALKNTKGVDKKKIVIDYLMEKNLKVDVEDIDNAIESAVLEMKTIIERA